MDLFIVSGDREQRLRIERRGGRFQLRYGERSFEVDAVRRGPVVSLLVEGRQAELVVVRSGRGRYRVSGVDGTLELEVRDPLTHLAASGRGVAGSRGTKQVTAHMPGRVVALLVAEGDTVEPGQGILVIEAMKMENEIHSEVGGVVQAFFVGQGQAVESGDALFEIG